MCSILADCIKDCVKCAVQHQVDLLHSFIKALSNLFVAAMAWGCASRTALYSMRVKSGHQTENDVWSYVCKSKFCALHA